MKIKIFFAALSMCFFYNLKPSGLPLNKVLLHIPPKHALFNPKIAASSEIVTKLLVPLTRLFMKQNGFCLESCDCINNSGPCHCLATQKFYAIKNLLEQTGKTNLPQFFQIAQTLVHSSECTSASEDTLFLEKEIRLVQDMYESQRPTFSAKDKKRIALNLYPKTVR